MYGRQFDRGVAYGNRKVLNGRTFLQGWFFIPNGWFWILSNTQCKPKACWALRLYHYPYSVIHGDLCAAMDTLIDQDGQWTLGMHSLWIIYGQQCTQHEIRALTWNIMHSALLQKLITNQNSQADNLHTKHRVVCCSAANIMIKVI